MSDEKETLKYATYLFTQFTTKAYKNMLREKFDLEFSLKNRLLMHLVIIIVSGDKHYCQLIGSFAPTAPAPMLSFLSVLQKKAD